MADAVLKIGAIVDKETIAAGMAEGAGSVDDATVKMSLSFEELQGRAKRAWSAIADDTKAAAAGVSAESLKVAETSRAVAEAKREEAAAGRLASNANLDQATTLGILAAAQEKSRAAEMARKDALAAVIPVEHQSVTSMQATSAAIRSLEGNAGLRAVEGFVSKTLGLGPLIQTLFPLVGAIAFGTILFNIGEKAVEVEQKAAHASETIGEAFATLHDRALITNDDLRIQIDRLELEREKLGGNPGNGLQLALDEAIKRADQLLVSLHADRKELAEIFKGNSVGMLGSILSGVQGTGTEEKQLLADNQALIGAVRKANEDYATEMQSAKTPEAIKAAGERHSKAVKASFDGQINTYKTEAARLLKEQQDSEALARQAADLREGGARVGTVSVTDNSAKIANLQGVIEQLQGRRDSFSLGEDLSKEETAVGQAKQDKSGAGGENKAAEAQMHKMEQANDALKFSLRNNHDEMVVENLNFWEQMLAPAAKYPANLAAVQQKVTAATAEYQAALNREVTKADEAKKRSAEADKQAFATLELMNNLLNEQDDDVNRVGGRWDNYNREVTKGQEIVTAHNLAMQEAALRAQEAMGSITPLAAAQQLAAIHTAAHTARLKELEAELAKLKAEAAGLKPGDKGYEENQTRQQGTQNAITTEKGAGQLQGAQDKTAIQNAVAKPYLAAFASIESGWLKVQRDLIAGNKNIGRDFREMGVNLVQSMAANAEKMLADWIRMEVRKVLMHRVSTMQMTATDAAGSAAAMGISKAQNSATGLDAAKRAFKSTYATVSDWPVVGPVLAPVLAATAFAAVAAFEKGGIVAGSPGMAVPILAHGGERVLTATQTNTFERMVNNTTSGGNGPLHFHMGGNTINGGKGTTMSDKDLARSIKRLHRLGHLKLASS